MMAKKSNIEKYNESLTQEQRKANASNAGIASGIARQEMATLRELTKNILQTKIDLSTIEGMEELKAVVGSKATAGELMLWAQILEGIKGNTSAAIFARDTAGEKPSDKVQLQTDIEMNDKLREVEAYIKGCGGNG